MKSRIAGWSLFVALGFVGSAFAGDPAPPKAAGYPDLSFAKVGGNDLLLDLYVPRVAEPPPLVIYIHGGAWTEGSQKNPPVRWLVDAGYALASISYRFSTEAPYPAQMFDCKAAVRWLRANAAKYGYDARRIAVVGESAGGHLAVLLGTTGGVAALEGDVGGHTDQSSRVQAIVDYYGPTDFMLREQTQPSMTDIPGSRVYRLLGGAPKDHPDLAKLASGAYQVTPDDPPLLIFHGADDTTVLPGQSIRLRDAYQAQKLEVSFTLVPHAQHAIGPFLAPPYRQQVLAFLHRHLR